MFVSESIETPPLYQLANNNWVYRDIIMDVRPGKRDQAEIGAGLSSTPSDCLAQDVR